MTDVDVDPTAFLIEFDPRERRMRGRAIHGNTPFDVPFISHVHGNLWQGGCQNGLVLPPDIINIVSLYPWEEYKRHENVQVYEADSDDDPEAPGGMSEVQILNLGARVNELCATGPTLVHCQAGLNRSSLIAAVSLLLADVVDSGEEAVSFLREKRSPACLCNQSFERWLTRKWPS